MSFHPGQKIVCINDDWGVPPAGFPAPPSLPQKGSVYHFAGPDPTNDAFLFVEEINHWRDPEFGLCGITFDASHFRPLDERATDISVFNTLLVPAERKRVLEDA